MTILDSQGKFRDMKEMTVYSFRVDNVLEMPQAR